MTEAAEITRRAKSNLAFALSVLPRRRREDAVLYYAFCRTLDDLADAPGMSPAARRASLMAWRDGLLHGFAHPEGLQREIAALRDRHGIPPGWLAALVEGCLEDLEPRRYATWQELDSYIWKVAGSVGLVSARLFGCQDPAADRYAETLGHGLQLTNILRDVGEDWHNGRRLYVPMEECGRAGVSEADLDAKASAGNFVEMMSRIASRARADFAEAERLLPASDRKALLPARIMSAIYQDLLGGMADDGFRVFQRRYRVPGWRKISILVKTRLRG